MSARLSSRAGRSEKPVERVIGGGPFRSSASDLMLARFWSMFEGLGGGGTTGARCLLDTVLALGIGLKTGRGIGRWSCGALSVRRFFSAYRQ